MNRRAWIGLVLPVCMAAAGCQTVASTYDRFFGRTPETRKPAELVQLKPLFNPRLLWQGRVFARSKDQIAELKFGLGQFYPPTTD